MRLEVQKAKHPKIANSVPTWTRVWVSRFIDVDSTLGLGLFVLTSFHEVNFSLTKSDSLGRLSDQAKVTRFGA